MRYLYAFRVGNTICKGRTFTEREALIFIATFIAIWDFSLIGNGLWIMPERSYNSTGTVNPKTKVRVRISRRTA